MNLIESQKKISNGNKLITRQRVKIEVNKMHFPQGVSVNKC